MACSAGCCCCTVYGPPKEKEITAEEIHKALHAECIKTEDTLRAKQQRKPHCGCDSDATICIDCVNAGNKSIKELALKLREELDDTTTRAELAEKRVGELSKLLSRLAEGCSVRKVQEDWPALKVLINRALEETK